MNENINVRFANLPTTIPGYAIQAPDGWTTFILNARCSHDKNLETYMHECGHVARDDFGSEKSTGEIECIAHKK
jgi:hypothetical protein